MKVPYHKASIDDQEIAEVVETLKSGWLTTGTRTKYFEEKFGEYVGARHAIALNSCTSALHLALDACGVKEGDSVLVPTMTFAATAEVVRYLNARPVFVDCHSDDQNMSLESLRHEYTKALSRGEKVTAVMPVHYGGTLCEMEEILEFSMSHGIKVIEDAAHCCPSFRKEGPNWVQSGSGSDICCYSFYANKCITTGEGGMATTNDDGIAARMRLMSLHGMSKDAWKRFSSDGNPEYLITAPGYKYNLSDLASSIGIHQLDKANQFREARERVAMWYFEALSDVEEVGLPKTREDRISSWHLFVIRILNCPDVETRRRIAEMLKEREIITSVHWRPLHMHPYYVQTYGYEASDFPIAARLYEQMISLPIYPTMSKEQVNYVAESLRVVLKNELG
jgi:dTDP-4-amino-4,6-dideoxygalactose transaminase